MTGASQHRKPPKEYFRYRGRYWSAPRATYEAILAYIEAHDEVPDLAQYPDVKQLSAGRPRHLHLSMIPILCRHGVTQP
jgi:hypothetical protein